jgi:hypothetical protein
MVSIPAVSPMKNAGEGGADIGANVLYRTIDGVLTGQPLWDPTTYEFPCGAEITGVNDPGTFAEACANVHTRLQVGTTGCGY